MGGKGGEVGIGIEARDIGIGEPLGFDHEVQRFGASALPLRQVDILEDIDHLQRGKALAVGRQFAQLVPILVAGAGGLDPFAAVGGKILAREGAALRLQVIDDHIGQIAVVIGIAPVAGDRLERVGKVRIAEDFARLGGFAIGEPDLARIAEIELVLARRIGLERAGEIHADDWRDRVAFARVADGRRQVCRHGPLAEAFVHGEPGIDRARHGDRQRAIGRQGVCPIELVEQLVERLTLRAAARPIDAVQFAGRGVVDDREQIAADAVAGRLHQPQRGIGRDGRIDRAAAVLEHVERDLRGKRVRSGRHAVLRNHRAACPIRAYGPPAGADLLFDRGLFGRLLRGGRHGGQGEGGYARQ